MSGDIISFVVVFVVEILFVFLEVMEIDGVMELFMIILMNVFFIVLILLSLVDVIIVFVCKVISCRGVVFVGIVILFFIMFFNL